MNEIQVREKFEAKIPQEKIDFLKMFYEMKARASVIEDEIKKAGEEFLIENNLLEEGYSQDGLTIIRTKDYERVSVDTDKMKEEGIYDLYTKKIQCKGHIKIDVEYDD